MYKQELKEAFSKLHASEDLMEEVLSLEKENRKSSNGRKMIWRVAACAAVLVLLVAVAFGNSEPFFSVQVYASETDYVKFDQKGDTIFIPAPDDSDDFSYRDDPSYRPELDSYITEEGGKLLNGPGFWLQLWLDDKTIDYDQIIIFVDGQQLDQSYHNGFWGYISKEDAKGRFIAIAVEKTTYVNIVLYDANGKVLQEYGMEVKPVEGGWYVILDKTYITSLGAAYFRKFS